MVQRLFYNIIKQCDHKYVTHFLGKQFYVLAPLDSSEKQIYGKGIAHLWKNEGVAPLQELLYITPDCCCNLKLITTPRVPRFHPQLLSCRLLHRLQKLNQ